MGRYWSKLLFFSFELMYSVVCRMSVKCEEHENGCKWQGEISDLPWHLTMQCPKKEKMCKKCKVRFPMNKHLEHSRECCLRVNFVITKCFHHLVQYSYIMFFIKIAGEKPLYSRNAGGSGSSHVPFWTWQGSFTVISLSFKNDDQKLSKCSDIYFW